METGRKVFFFLIFFIFGCVGSLLLRGGPSLVAGSRGYSSLRCTGLSLSGFSCCRAWALGAGFSSCGLLASIVVAHGLSCSVACGIFLDQGSNLCPLHWQVDS